VLEGRRDREERVTHLEVLPVQSCPLDPDLGHDGRPQLGLTDFADVLEERAECRGREEVIGASVSGAAEKARGEVSLDVRACGRTRPPEETSYLRSLPVGGLLQVSTERYLRVEEEFGDLKKAF
jgi:hypothetical protein